MSLRPARGPSPGEDPETTGAPRRHLGPGLALLVAAAAGLVAGVAVHVRAPEPVAATAHGTDEAFGTGRTRRLVTGAGLQRWTGRRDSYRFLHLPGPATAVEVTVHNSMGAPPVTVLVRGVRVGTVVPGRPHARFELPVTVGRDVALDLQTDPLPGSPGALVERVHLEHARGAGPDPALLLLFVVPAVAVAAAGLLAAVTPGVATAVALAATALLAVTLEPWGLVRSPWALTASSTLAGGALLAGALARFVNRGRPGAGPWAFAAALAALLVQGLAAVSPLMPVSDAMFHAHKLHEVARGELFPVSLTQHAQPFRFPYGVAFYALLVPFLKAGLDPIAVVRWAAALASLLASGALFGVLLPRGRAQASLAVVALQVLPVTFTVHSYGNLSNVFGQALTVLFFAWWAGSARGGAAVGALLVALASLAHFSSLVVLGVTAVVLVVLRRRAGALGTTRIVTVAAGLALAGAYYATFVPMVLEQLPRLLEGGGTGRVARGLLGELVDELRWMGVHWGLPAIALAVLGRPQPSRGTLDRDVLGLWIGGALLGVLALLTPVEVRYVYALTLPLAIAAGEGLVALSARGTGGVLLAVALGLAQVLVAGASLLDAVFARYR